MNSKTKRTTYEIHKLIDRLSFLNLLIIWISITILFGLIYFFLSGPTAYLETTSTNQPITTLFESVYFSFITSTTTGFGDIIPKGFFRLISILEVIFDLLMIAIVTSKLISMKQNVILEELYEITFSEKINRIRSSLLYSRQNLSVLIHKIEDGVIKKREIKNLYLNFISFQETLEEINVSLQKKKSNEFVKNIDDVNAGIIANSIIYSLHRIEEAITHLSLNNLSWQTDKNIHYLEKIILLIREFFEVLQKTKILPKDVYDNLNEEKKLIIKKIKDLESKIK